MAILVREYDENGNISQEGTPLTDDVFKQINWKEDKSLEFMRLNSNVLPSSKTGAS